MFLPVVCVLCFLNPVTWPKIAAVHHDNIAAIAFGEELHRRRGRLGPGRCLAKQPVVARVAFVPKSNWQPWSRGVGRHATGTGARLVFDFVLLYFLKVGWAVN